MGIARFIDRREPSDRVRREQVVDLGVRQRSHRANDASPLHTSTARGEPVSSRQGFGLPDLSAGFETTFSSRTIDVRGVRLHAVIGGRGLPLLLVGGWPQFWWQWRKVMPQLARSFHLVVVDPRGFGQSDKPTDGYDCATAAADLVGLMDVLGHSRFAVMGQDLGMWICYALAADHPDHVTRLVLMEGEIPGVSDPPLAIPDHAADVSRVWHLMFNRLATLNEQLIQGREHLFLANQFAVKGAHPTAIPAAAVEVYARALQAPGALSASFNYYRALDETIAQNRQRSRRPLRIPVLAVGGAASMGPSVARDVARVASDVRPLSIPDCGHYVAEEAPARLITEFTKFMDRRP